MTDHNDILARIFSLIESPGYYEAKPHKAHADLERVRAALSALIPEPPTDGEGAWLERVNRALFKYDRGELDVRGVAAALIPEPPTDEPKCAHGIGLTDLCEHVERLVNAEPPTDDEREALATRLEREFGSFLAHWPADPARFFRQAADGVMSDPIWRNRGRRPITDEAVDAAYNLLCGLVLPSIDDVRAALEAARDAEGLR